MSSAQDGTGDKKTEKDFQQVFFGVGLGFDYGGIGMKGEFLPTNWLGLFVGGGYNLADPAFNAGFSLKALTAKNVNPLFVAMYGYNAAIKIKSFGFSGSDLHRKTYYGVSVGGGVDVKFGSKGSKATFLLLVPFRSDSFKRDYDGLKDAGFEFKPDISPIAFSVGCNFAIGSKAL
jgi:hypothetical protein